MDAHGHVATLEGVPNLDSGPRSMIDAAWGMSQLRSHHGFHRRRCVLQTPPRADRFRGALRGPRAMGREEPTGFWPTPRRRLAERAAPPFLPRNQLLELTWNDACEPLSFRAWATVLHTSPLPSTSLRMSRVSVAGPTRICEGSTTRKEARFDDDRAIIPSVSWTLRGQNKS